MRFEGFHATAFGSLLDTGASGLAPGLTVVVGPNGAGKSSLHALLVRTLFEFPRSNAAEVDRHFEPLDGRAHDATVVLVDGEGRDWTVRRRRSGSPRLQVDGPDGTATEQRALEPLVPGLDRGAFERLFAIDLSRLVDMGDMPAEELQSQLFGEATLATSRSLRGARLLAEERAAALYVPAGRTREVNEARNARDELRSELRAAQREAAEASGQRDEVRRLDARAERLLEELTRLGSRRRLVERVQEQRPAAVEARTAREQAAAATGPDVAPELRERRGAARADRTAAEAELAGVDEREAAVDHEATGLPAPDEALADVAERVRSAERRREVLAQQQADLATARAEAERLERVAADAVADVGPGWDAAAVSAVDTDTTTLAAVATAGEAVTAARAAVDRAEHAARAARRNVATLADRAADADERAAGSAEPSDLGARATALEVAQVAHRAVAAADAAARARDAGAAGTSRSGPARTLVAAGVLTALVGLGLGVTGASGAVVGIAGVVAVALVAYGVHLLPPGRGAAPVPVDTAADDRARLASAATTLGLSTPVSAESITAAAATLEQDRLALADLRELRAGAAAAHRAASDATAELRDLESEVETASAARDAAVDHWRRTLSAVGLVDDEDRPDGPPDVQVVVARHRAARTAAAALDAARRGRATADELDQRVATGLAAVRELLLDAGREPGDDLLADLARLAADVAEDEQLRSRHDELARRRRTLRGERERAQQRLDDAEDRLAEVRRALDLDDEEAVDAAVRAHDLRTGLLARADELEAVVDRAFGTGPDARTARELLTTDDVGAWEDELADLERRREQLATERDEVLTERARLEQRLGDLMDDDRVPRLATRLAEAEDRLRDVLHRWAVLSTASRLLGHAVEQFESRQAPEVLREAARLFGEFTLGVFEDVRILEGSGDERRLVAVRDGAVVEAVDLSTGERTQLLLALRVALALNQPAAAPLLLDDLLGTVDDERSDAIARSLGVISRDRQVLLFTPSERSAAAALDAVGGVDGAGGPGLLRLERGRVVEAVPGRVA